MYKGDLVLRQLSYSKHKLKWAYKIIEDKVGFYKIVDERKILPSRVVLKYLTLGYKIEFVDDNGKSICVLGKIK